MSSNLITGLMKRILDALLKVPHKINDSNNPLHELAIESILEALGVTFLGHPVGTQREPDCLIQVNKTEDLGVLLQAKSTLKSSTPSGSKPPEPEGIHVFSCKEAEPKPTTLFLGISIISEVKLKLFWELFTELRAIKTRYTKMPEGSNSDDRGGNYRVSSRIDHDKEIDFFEKNLRKAHEALVFEVCSKMEDMDPALVPYRIKSYESPSNEISYVFKIVSLDKIALSIRTKKVQHQVGRSWSIAGFC